MQVTNVTNVELINQLNQETLPSFQLSSAINPNLGFGHLFYGFAKLLRPENTVVIGSKGGFAPILFALGVKENAGFGIAEIGCSETELDNTSKSGHVDFIDPSYSIERADSNHWYGQGQWDDAGEVIKKWRRFGVENIITHHKLTSKEYLSALPPERKIDLLYVDGDHSYAGIMHDLLAFHSRLHSRSVVIAHDVYPSCPEAKGYEVLRDLPPNLYEYIRITIYPRLAIMRKKSE